MRMRLVAPAVAVLVISLLAACQMTTNTGEPIDMYWTETPIFAMAVALIVFFVAAVIACMIVFSLLKGVFMLLGAAWRWLRKE